MFTNQIKQMPTKVPSQMNEFKGLLTLKKKEQHKSCQLSFIWVKWGLQPERQPFRQLWRGRGQGWYVCDFSERGIWVVSHTFWQKAAAGHKKAVASHKEHRCLH